MTDKFTVHTVVVLLGAIAVLGVGFIGYLASVGRGVPDALVAIPSGAAGALAAVLARTSSSDSTR